MEQILRPHAFINARIDKGMITFFEQYRDLPLRQDVCSKVASFKVRQPKHLKIMLEDERKQIQTMDLLVLDDFGFRRYDSKEAELLYALADERLRTVSTVHHIQSFTARLVRSLP